MSKLHTGKHFVVMGLRNHQSIAYAVISELRRQGAEVIATCMSDRMCAKVEPIAQELGVVLLPCDATNPDEIEQLFARIQEIPGWRGKVIDGVVHSIAFAKTMTVVTDIPIREMADQINLAMNTSATSFMMVAQVAHPYMTFGSAFIAFGYGGGKRGESGYDGPIGLAKVALEHMMKAMARTYGPDGYRALLVSPGPIETAAAKGITGFDVMQKRAIDQSPLHEAVTAEDAANAVSFLLSEGAHHMTGFEFPVDGGRLIVHENA